MYKDSLYIIKYLQHYRKLLDKNTRRTLVLALVQCHFDYAITAWYGSLNKQFKNKLQIAQNKLVRYILDLQPRSHLSQNDMDSIGMLFIRDRAKQLMLNHMHNVYYKRKPAYLADEFQLVQHNYYTRGSQHNFYLPKNIGIAFFNFNFQGVKLWNNLPPSIQGIESKQLFKKKVKLFLKTQSHKNETCNVIYY